MRKPSAVLNILFLLVYCSRLWLLGEALTTEHEPDDPDQDQDADYHEDYTLDDVATSRIVAGCEEGMFQCADK